jgi:hypothetical protein
VIPRHWKCRSNPVRAKKGYERKVNIIRHKSINLCIRNDFNYNIYVMMGGQQQQQQQRNKYGTHATTGSTTANRSLPVHSKNSILLGKQRIGYDRPVSGRPP